MFFLHIKFANIVNIMFKIVLWQFQLLMQHDIVWRKLKLTNCLQLSG
jgi:hypothetical protein